GGNLGDVDMRLAGGAADVYPAKLVLGTLLAELGVIDELVDELEFRGHAELLLEPAMYGFIHLLARARMRAAGVGPVARPQPLLGAALLQQQLALLVEDEQRERPVQHAGGIVRLGLADGADLVVVLVDKHQQLAVIGNGFVTRGVCSHDSSPSGGACLTRQRLTKKCARRMRQVPPISRRRSLPSPGSPCPASPSSPALRCRGTV